MIQKNIYISVNGVDLSSSLRALEFEEGAEPVAAEAHGDDWRWFEEGLKTGALTCQFKQSYTSGGVDETLSALPSTFVVIVKPNGSTTSGTNPKFTMTMMRENYQRFTGLIGELAICTLQLSLAANTGVVRAESDA